MNPEIFEIIRTKNSEQVRMFLKENPDQINARNEAGQTALLAAVSDKKLKTVKMFFEEFGANIDDESTARQTAMDIASNNSDLPMTHFLGRQIQLQLNNFIADHDGDKDQALISAVRTGKKEFISSLLIDRDTDTNAGDVVEGKTAFMVAVELGKFKEALMLLPKSKIDAKDKNGNTAFMIATAGGNPEMMEFLLKNGANDLAINHDGKTALMNIENDSERAKIAAFIKDKKPAPPSLFSTKFITKTYLKKDSKNRVEKAYDLESPTFEGAFILAEYYKLNYGIKIAITDIENGRKEIMDFVNNNHDDKFQFGIIHYDIAHNVGHVFEKSGDGISLVSLDSMHGLSELCHGAKIEIPQLNVFYPEEGNILQVDGRCATYAFQMTKDALRMPSVTQEFKTAAQIINTENGKTKFSKFPPKLLKYAETSRSVKDVDQKEPVIRSSVKKPKILLSDYRAKHLKTEVVRTNWNEEESRPERNFKIYGKEFSKKVKKVLDFYGVDKSNLSAFISSLKQAQKESLANGTFANPITTQAELKQQAQLHFTFLENPPKDIPAWSKVEEPKPSPAPLKDEQRVVGSSCCLPSFLNIFGLRR